MLSWQGVDILDKNVWTDDGMDHRYALKFTLMKRLYAKSHIIWPQFHFTWPHLSQGMATVINSTTDKRRPQASLQFDNSLQVVYRLYKTICLNGHDHIYGIKIFLTWETPGKIGFWIDCSRKFGTNRTQKTKIPKIGFSREGSLTRTLIQLTEKSSMGLTAEQIWDKLQCRCHAVLVKLYREGRLQRQKQGRSYVYLAADAQIASIQHLALSKTHAPKLPAEMAVLVLAEFIRTPEVKIQQLAKTISHRTGVIIKSEQVQMLFEQHGLEKKLNLRRKSLDCAGSMPYTAQAGNLAGHLVPATSGYPVQARS